MAAGSLGDGRLGSLAHGALSGRRDEHGRAVEAVENLAGGGDAAAEGEGGVLHHGYPVTVGGEVIVDALPA